MSSEWLPQNTNPDITEASITPVTTTTLAVSEAQSISDLSFPGPPPGKEKQ